MRRPDLSACRQVPLTVDDRLILETIYHSRLRTFSVVFAVMSLVLFWKGGAYLMQLGSASMNGLIGWTVLVMLLLCPALIVYFRSIRPYGRDLRAGFKYSVDEAVTGKSYFPHTGQYFIALDDVQYMHH